MSLAVAGVRPGDRVATFLPNCDALLIHYLACFKAGYVAVPLNYRYTPSEIDRALRTCRPQMLVFDQSRISDIAAASEVDQLPLGTLPWGPSDSDFADLLREQDSSPMVPVQAGNAPAVIFFTSGSTGPAKGVTHSAESLAYIFHTFGRVLEMGAGDAVIALGSMSHIGAFMDLFSGLWFGARVVIPPSLDAKDLLVAIRAERPTHGIAVPAVLFRAVQDPEARPDDFASFRMLGTGGDSVPTEMRRLVRTLGGPEINEQFSMTEVGVVTQNPMGAEVKPGSVGTLVPGYELEIRDRHRQQVSRGEKGRLWVRSPGVMLGYWGSPEATAEVLVDGWFDTGDVLSKDDDGYLWFHGRQKQIIVHDGSNITPQEVEDALLLHPDISMAGVVGVSDQQHGENVRAFVTLTPGVDTLDVPSVITFARTRIGYKAPESIIVLERLPLTSSNKVDRTALRQLSDSTA
jgi:acyl-CoA synthetase (AMP-forming)/AMP-acid ligase II